MLNRVVLTGRLTKDAELRYTTSGTAVASFNLAVTRQYRDQNGERQADFIRCIIWRKSAENFTSFTHKGSLVGIEGRLSTRNYENNQGQRVFVTEVVVDSFALLESKREQQGNSANQYDSGHLSANQAPYNAPNQSTGDANSQPPYQGNQNNNQTQVDQDGNIDIDDLPF